MSTGWRFNSIVGCLSLLAVAGMATAQVQRRGGQRATGPGSRVNQEDRQATQQRTMERLQQQLEASEDQWQVIEPKLQKVMELTRQQARRRLDVARERLAARPGQGQRRQNQNGQIRQPRSDANREVTAVQKAYEELDTLLNSSNASPEQIKAKLAALRTARETEKKELAVARDALKQVVTAKQEARLVLLGLLE